MLTVLITAHATSIPGWLQAPQWLLPVSRAIGHFVRSHETLGLFLVVFAEELGIPLPFPGDAAITYAGYQTTTGAIPYPLAYVAVISAATSGSLCLYSLSHRFGRPFIVRFGPYVGLTTERLEQAERAFGRWGPWAVIIGRHIPGARIVLSAFAGMFQLPRRLFVPCVLVSSAIWAAIFLELGRLLGRNSRFLFRLVPIHLLPLVIVLIALAWVFWLAREHRSRSRGESRRGGDGVTKPPPARPSKAEGRTAKM
jgi:membrane protein DedA with SNARE-associated domain